MTNTLTYPGNVTDMVGKYVGPSTDGRLHVAVDATHDPATDKTRVVFDQVDPSTLAGTR